MMIFSWIKTINRKRAQLMVERIEPFITKSKNIIDVGSGTGNVTLILREKGKAVIPVDVADFHNTRIIKPIIYDGKRLPFKNQSFNTALLITVLHHTPHPELVLKEAARVAREIVIVETSYTNIWHKIYTVIMDTIINLQFQAHWNSYKSDHDWRKLFKAEGLEIIKIHKYIDSELFLHILYYLRKNNLYVS